MSKNKKNKSSGFTLLEIIVVIGITVLLSTLAVTYNRSNERQLLMFRSQSEIVSAMNRARALALERFDEPVEGKDLCGVGVRVSGEKDFHIFLDLENKGNCLNSDRRYSGSEEDFESFELAPQVEFAQGTSQGLEVLFVSPHLDVISSESFPVEIELISLDVNNAKIHISAVGQISIQEIVNQ
ncbi:MAG: type II secretion system protein [Candidatus Paceibacterota bacterium]